MANAHGKSTGKKSYLRATQREQAEGGRRGSITRTILQRQIASKDRMSQKMRRSQKSRTYCQSFFWFFFFVIKNNFILTYMIERGMNTNITNLKALPNQKPDTEVDTKDVKLIIHAIFKTVSNPQINQTKAL
jgi:hypothetical protein